MKITINIDKEVLFMTRYCGVNDSVYKEGEYFKNPFRPELHNNIMSNCAISYAVQKLFPYVRVTNVAIFYFANHIKLSGYWLKSLLSAEVKSFINKFDNSTPEERIEMQPFSFEIEVPQEVIEHIGIEEIHKSLKESKHVELV